MTEPRPRLVLACLAASLALVAGACSSSGSDAASDASTTSTTTTTVDEAPTLTVLVSNDDGIGAPGIDAVAVALADLPDTEVVVAAPAENQSGKGSTTTPDAPSSPGATTSGIEGFAVTGTPADAVNWALDGGVETEPQLVVTGLNEGQNLGAVGDQFSGTIGAARAAAAHGIPALATSMGFGDEIDYSVGVQFVVDWVQEHREQLLAGDMSGTEVVVVNLNVPSCPAGEVRGLADTEMSSEGGEAAVSIADCTSAAPAPTDDIGAFNIGFATLSSIPLAGSAPR